jgi:hypothetical protein
MLWQGFYWQAGLTLSILKWKILYVAVRMMKRGHQGNFYSLMILFITAANCRSPDLKNHKTRIKSRNLGKVYTLKISVNCTCLAQNSMCDYHCVGVVPQMWCKIPQIVSLLCM